MISSLTGGERVLESNINYDRLLTRPGCIYRVCAIYQRRCIGYLDRVPALTVYSSNARLSFSDLAALTSICLAQCRETIDSRYFIFSSPRNIIIPKFLSIFSRNSRSMIAYFFLLFAPRQKTLHRNFGNKVGCFVYKEMESKLDGVSFWWKKIGD